MEPRLVSGFVGWRSGVGRLCSCCSHSYDNWPECLHCWFQSCWFVRWVGRKMIVRRPTDNVQILHFIKFVFSHLVG